jgi:AcrB/AcrD/AcrF family
MNQGDNGGSGLLKTIVRQPVLVLLAIAVLSVIGAIIVVDLPIEAFPDVQDTQVQVITQAPGRAPEEVERSISQPIERELGGTPRATRIRSVSITGLSVVTARTARMIFLHVRRYLNAFKMPRFRAALHRSLRRYQMRLAKCFVMSFKHPRICQKMKLGCYKTG